MVEERFGVRPTDGGAHVGLGTRNALLALGGTTYLEVIGPDLDQETPKGPRPFGIDDLSEPKLVTWASPSSDLDGVLARAQGAGVDLGKAFDMSRRKPDGELLEWRLTMRSWTRSVEPIPFFIDWGRTPSPARTLKAGVHLSAFYVFHPEDDLLKKAYAGLGFPLKAEKHSDAKLEISVETSTGLVTLS